MSALDLTQEYEAPVKPDLTAEYVAPKKPDLTAEYQAPSKAAANSRAFAANTARMALPVIGGILGTPADIATGPGGTIAGAALGGLAGEQLGQLIEGRDVYAPENIRATVGAGLTAPLMVAMPITSAPLRAPVANLMKQAFVGGAVGAGSQLAYQTATTGDFSGKDVTLTGGIGALLGLLGGNMQNVQRQNQAFAIAKGMGYNGENTLSGLKSWANDQVVARAKQVNAEVPDMPAPTTPTQAVSQALLPAPLAHPALVEPGIAAQTLPKEPVFPLLPAPKGTSTAYVDVHGRPVALDNGTYKLQGDTPQPNEQVQAAQDATAKAQEMVQELVQPKPAPIANQAAEVAATVKKGTQNVQVANNSLGKAPEQPEPTEQRPTLPEQPLQAAPQDFAPLDSWLGRTTQKPEMISNALATKDVDYQYSVFRPGQGFPSAVQVDVIAPDKSESLVSANVTELNAAGAKLPEVPEWIPQGRYTLAQMNSLIKAGPDNPVTIQAATPVQLQTQPNNALQVQEPTSQVLRPEIAQPEQHLELQGVVGQDRLQEPAVQGGEKEQVTAKPTLPEGPLPDKPFVVFTGPSMLGQWLKSKAKGAWTPDANGQIPTKTVPNLLKKLGVTDDEMAIYQMAGIDRFMAHDKVNVRELQQWMKSNSPVIELKELTPDKVSSEISQDQHYLETQGFIVEQDRVWEPDTYGGGLIEDITHEKYKDYGNRTMAAIDRVKRSGRTMSSDAATGKYGVEPKSLDKMSGAVDLLGRLPAKSPAAKHWREIQNPTPESGVLYRGPHFGGSDVNVIFSNRMYVETLPSGEKVLHVFEVQSDWGQKVAQEKKKPSFAENYNEDMGRPQPHPLLAVYNQLALKAAIAYARKLGITKVAISDAETAMMTEGHDRYARQGDSKIIHEANLSMDQAFDMVTKLNKEAAPGELYHIFGYPDNLDGKGNTGIAKKVTIIPQDSGMRAAYDQTLPAIMQKLTGDAGVPVDFGEHRAAGNQPNPGETSLGQKGSPVFKDAWGNPKTNVTARMYDTGGAPKNFKAFGYGEAQGGFITPIWAMQLAGAASGAVAGFEAGDTPEERLKYALAGGLVGFFLTRGAAKLIFARSRIGMQWSRELLGTPQLMAERGARLKQAYHTWPVKEEMVVGKEAAENASDIFAVQQSNVIRHALSRTFGAKASKVAEQALTLVVEAKGDPMVIAAMKAQVAASPKAAPLWQKRFDAAADFALAHLADLRPVAADYTKAHNAEHALENSLGVESPYREGYVFHAQDLDSDEPLGGLLSAHGTGDTASFKKMREHDTFADSISAGVDPKSINAADLMQTRLRVGQRMVNDRVWLADIKTLQDPTTGQPVVINAQQATRPDGTHYDEAPQGYKLQYMRGVALAVANDYVGAYQRLTEPGIGAQGFGKLVQVFNQTGKAGKLAIDTFHLGRITFAEMGTKAAGVTTMKAPIPSWMSVIGANSRGASWSTKMKGLALVDNTPEEIGMMVKHGEVPLSWGSDLMNQKARIDLLVRQGLKVGSIIDNLHQDFIHSIPGISQFNKFLFSQYQRSAMVEGALIELERQKAMFPELTEAQVARKVAMDINTKFGNLGRRGWFKSRKQQDVARLLMLAPEWVQGQIRSESGAIGELPKIAKDVLTGKGLRSGLLPRVMASMLIGYFLMNQIINVITRGHPTWDNPEEGFDKKISAWIPDLVGTSSGFFLNPMGLAAEITHVMSKKFERGQTTWDALTDFAQSRASYITGPLWLMARNKQPGGIPVAPDQMGKSLVNVAQPLPIPATAFWSALEQAFTGRPSEDFPGQFQRQAISSLGVRPDIAPSPSSRIYDLAAKYNEAHGVPAKPQFGPGPFADLNRALAVGNMKNADREIGRLMLTHTPRQIFDYYQNGVDKSFTGSAERDAGFIRSLNHEQMQQAFKAYDTRKQSFARAGQALLAAHANGTAAKAYITRMDAMSDEDARNFLTDERENGYLDATIQDQILAIRADQRKK